SIDTGSDVEVIANGYTRPRRGLSCTCGLAHCQSGPKAMYSMRATSVCLLRIFTTPPSAGSTVQPSYALGSNAGGPPLSSFGSALRLPWLTGSAGGGE